MNGLALCAGVGGLELGIERVFPSCKTVAYVEGEAFAAANLVSKMEAGILDEAPIWSDLRTFDGTPFSRKVDIVSAGFPCQPFSRAGKREGTRDERHLWPHVSRIIGEVRPSIIVLENVPGVIDDAGLGITFDLSEMGYDFAWGIVRASEAGAPHRRARFFGVGIVSDSDGQSESDGPFESEKGGIVSESASDSRCESSGLQIQGGLSAIKGAGGIGLPREIGGNEGAWTAEPGVCRVADGVAHWVDRLRACGNGVVPHQAELAIRILLNTLIERRNQV